MKEVHHIAAPTFYPPAKSLINIHIDISLLGPNKIAELFIIRV